MASKKEFLIQFALNENKKGDAVTASRRGRLIAEELNAGHR